jgi:endogenous inhibitor of DNA gyrase (YacG/DUF329 family)
VSEITILQCNKCGKTTETNNHYKAGWIMVEGEISVGTGKHDTKRGGYVSQWINASEDKPYHFCSWKCLMEYDDNKS